MEGAVDQAEVQVILRHVLWRSAPIETLHAVLFSPVGVHHLEFAAALVELGKVSAHRAD